MAKCKGPACKPGAGAKKVAGMIKKSSPKKGGKGC